MLLVAPPAAARPGSIDTYFGKGGMRQISYGDSTGIQPDPDGGLLVAGWVTSGRGESRDELLARLRDDGSLDPGFSDDGRVDDAWENAYSEAWDVVRQPDGKLVLVGSSWNSDTWQRLALARLNPDGSRDMTFGVLGRIVESFGHERAEAFDAVLQPDGKLVVAGYVRDQEATRLLLVRFTGNGAVDPTFGNQGRVETSFGRSVAQGTELVRQADGKLVVGGFVAASGSWRSLLARYTTDGTLDESFDDDGKILGRLRSESTQVSALLHDARGRLLAAETRRDYGGSAVVRRYGAEGVPDASFGERGQTERVGTRVNSGAGLVAQQDGAIVLAVGDLIRFRADGTIDRTFGSRGRASYQGPPASPWSSSFSTAALTSDGKLLVAGFCWCQANWITGINTARVFLKPLGRFGAVARRQRARPGYSSIRIPLVCTEPCAMRVSLQVSGQTARRAGIGSGRSPVTVGREFAINEYGGPDEIYTGLASNGQRALNRLGSLPTKVTARFDGAPNEPDIAVRHITLVR